MADNKCEHIEARFAGGVIWRHGIEPPIECVFCLVDAVCALLNLLNTITEESGGAYPRADGGAQARALALISHRLDGPAAATAPRPTPPEGE